MITKLVFLLIGALFITNTSSANQSFEKELYFFTEKDRQFLAQFSLSQLPPKPTAPSNAYADNTDAAILGKKLFFDARLSKNQQVACSSCHQPQKYFTDGLVRSQGVGITRRNSPSIVFSAYSPWQYWDGRKDSLWSQALNPLESEHEQGLDRVSLVKVVLSYYANDYRKIFGDKDNKEFKRIAQVFKPASPKGNTEEQESWQHLDTETQFDINRVFSNMGKALMAYQRQLTLSIAPFDQFVNRLSQLEPKYNINEYLDELKGLMSPSEVSGLRLFMTKAQCVSCHNGPLFSNFEFHNVGAPETDLRTVDLGRYDGVSQLQNDEFTCLSRWSDATESQCEEMNFLKKQGPELVGAFKTPSLRNVAETAPYMQSGQFPNLESVLEHYNRPVPPLYDRTQHPNRPHFDILPLGLTSQEIQDIEAFLKTLTSPLPKADVWWQE